MKLTKPQLEAVEYNQGPYLIIAGAGTGKTTVLVEKIKYLIKENLARPEEILALTFTDKAAREMEERVDRALPYGYFQMSISTFHGWCDRILRDEAAHIGLSPAYKLQTQTQQILFLKKNLFLFDLTYFRPLGNPNKFVEGLIAHFSRLRDEDVSPKEYIDWAKSKSEKRETSDDNKIEIEKNIELAKAYKKFQDLKTRENIMDFADLIFYTLELFRKRPNILKKYQDQFKYILVDEFQDTNIAQYELIKLLAPTSSNPKLTVIGDDNQSIYKFRGASVSNILKFMEDYKKAQSIVLTDNFRSNQKILDTSYQLIKNNDPDTLESRLNISKDLKSNVGAGDKTSVNFKFSDRVENEADFVASEIKKLKEKFDWRDFAILVRANNHADSFVRALQRKGIPYQFLGPGSLFKQPEIKELIAYLNVLYDINDSASFFRVISMDIFKLDPKDIAALISFTRRTRLSLFESMEIYLSFFYPELFKEDFTNYKAYLFTVKEDSRIKLRKIHELVSRGLSLLKKETAGQILFYFLEDSGLLANLMKYKTEREEKAALNISKFFDRLRSFEVEEEDASVFTVVDYLKMSMELGESPTGANIDWTEYNAVNILTVHSAKGLEFPVVFMVNLTTDRFPTRERKEQIPIPDDLIKEILPEGNYHLQEERRLFYVGLTRAKDKIYLTSANYYGEGKRERKISPYVVESLGEDIIEKEKNQHSMAKSQLSIYDLGFGEGSGQKEVAADKDRTLINSFSFSQIDTYKICPLRYKYQYILKIPTPPSAAASFGESIHKALQTFYQQYKLGENPSLETLLKTYKEVWIPMGYTSKEYESKMKKEGEKILKDYFEKYHSQNLKIRDLEKWFKIKVSDKVFISGKIDRVDESGSGVEIIDYKTGKKPPDADLKKSLQMGIYALAATDPGLYKKRVDDIVLTFYFLTSDDKISMKKTALDLQDVKKQIEDVAENINRSQFEAQVGPWCDFCPFRINCEAWQ